MNKRQLIFSDPSRDLSSHYISHTDIINYENTFSVSNFLKNNKTIALDVTVQIFRSFNWDDATKQFFKDEQEKFLKMRH